MDTGPPESMREHVVAASKAMRIGNWRACKDYIINEKMNSKVKIKKEGGDISNVSNINYFLLKF